MTSSVYNYVNTSKLWLPMTAECHDAVNNRTLDLSGNGNHATFGDGAVAGTFPTKLAARGYRFDGSSDYLNVGNKASLDFTTTGTLGIMFKCSASALQFLIGKEKWLAGREGYSIYINGPTAFVAELRQVAAGSVSVSDAIRTVEQVVHVAILTWNGTTAFHYLDGYVNSAAQTLNAAPQNWEFRIGLNPDAGTAYYLNGTVYWAGAWNTAFTAAQARDLEMRLRRQLNDM